jgi:hypothetical protein
MEQQILNFLKKHPFRWWRVGYIAEQLGAPTQKVAFHITKLREQKKIKITSVGFVLYVKHKFFA